MAGARTTTVVASTSVVVLSNWLEDTTTTLLVTTLGSQRISIFNSTIHEICRKCSQSQNVTFLTYFVFPSDNAAKTSWTTPLWLPKSNGPSRLLVGSGVPTSTFAILTWFRHFLTTIHVGSLGWRKSYSYFSAWTSALMPVTLHLALVPSTEEPMVLLYVPRSLHSARQQIRFENFLSRPSFASC